MMSVVLQTVLTGLKPNDQRVTESVEVNIFIHDKDTAGFLIILFQHPNTLKVNSVTK